jgi:hypothetical protein
MRLLLNGPRSLIRTTTLRPLRTLVTRTIVPKGKVRCAAVSFAEENASPLVVVPPFCVQMAAINGLPATAAALVVRSKATQTALITLLDTVLRTVLDLRSVFYPHPWQATTRHTENRANSTQIRDRLSKKTRGGQFGSDQAVVKWNHCHYGAISAKGRTKDYFVMTVKSAACAMAVALLAGTAAFTVPAAAQYAAKPPSHAKMSSSHDKRLFLSAVAVYDAGLRRGRTSSSNSAYLRGFRDGTSSEAYSSRAYVARTYVMNPYTVNPAPPVTGYSLYDSAGYVPVTSGYSSYGSYGTPSVAGYSRYDSAGYVPVTSGYSSYGSYGTPSISYDDGYATNRYDQGYAPRRLMDVAVAPVVMQPPSTTRAAHLNYCAARYLSFDPASDTFLAYDGNRYFCQ